MSEKPRLRFLSIFVPDLAGAVRRYREVLGVEPVDGPGAAPREHPFAALGPIVFDLGGVALALYECDGRATHPGDVGIGLEVDGSPAPMAGRAAAQKGKVFFGPRRFSESEDECREMAVFVLPDRHLFEVVSS